MVGHIYGRLQLLCDTYRPNMFINELRLYIDYMKSELQKRLETWNVKEQKYFDSFRKNLGDGIAHYKELIPQLIDESERYREMMHQELLALEQELIELVIPSIPQPA
jgi:predicted PolB exonuclease-like 3'-5' exonuclease